MQLEPIDAETALDLYLAEREAEIANSTRYARNSRLSFFVEWCDQRGIGNLNTLTGRKLHEYRLWRRNIGELAKASEKTQMDTLRVFVHWLESIDSTAGCQNQPAE